MTHKNNVTANRQSNLKQHKPAEKYTKERHSVSSAST